MRTILILSLLTACARTPEAIPDSTIPPSGGATGMTGTTGSTGGQTQTPPSSDTGAPATADITLRTDRQRYRAGDPIELTLVNRTGSRYSYNPCTRIIEQSTGSSWTAVREDRMCTMIAHVLDPNATRVERTELAQQLAPGRYRIVLLLTESRTDGSSRSVRATAPIEVGS